MFDNALLCKDLMYELGGCLEPFPSIWEGAYVLSLYKSKIVPIILWRYIFGDIWLQVDCYCHLRFNS